MEKEIVLRSGKVGGSNPCSGCIFLKRNKKTDMLDCDMPMDFDYSKYGNCGEKTSCVYVYIDPDKKKNYSKRIYPSTQVCQMSGWATKQDRDVEDVETKNFIVDLEAGTKTVREVAYELGVSKKTVYNRVLSYAKRKKVKVVLAGRKTTTKRRHREIEELLDSGMSIPDIANRVGRTERLIRIVKSNYIKRIEHEMDKSKVR